MKSKTKTGRAAKNGTLHINKKVAGGATGAVVGAVMGGPVGAVVGGVVGTAIGSFAGAGAPASGHNSTSLKRLSVKPANRSTLRVKKTSNHAKSKRPGLIRAVKTSRTRKSATRKAIRGSRNRKKE